VYNTILRRWPVARYEAFNAGRNLYPTTIHVLVSAIQKIACVMKLPENLVLYRGLGGVRLPDCFHRADENGCRGFAEWGFMSTTSSKEVAISYSGLDDRRPMPTVFEIRVGAVDRGACIREFSQYPAEIECEPPAVPSLHAPPGLSALTATSENTCSFVVMGIQHTLAHTSQHRSMHMQASTVARTCKHTQTYSSRLRARASTTLRWVLFYISYD
jgi:hypothetical protein